ncbi:hypothetical protein FH972_022630 [Carpinus fangiana]|uniref:Major facilitator superfamily (MFS) profile domain-containing protein n=1 Tax=Carpinus fangiana TaxID=176857 RepID=A0A5N6KTG6_9ROSI|nr:hypothetical protein FH972_022630 [Carpinus fangiana]
MGKLEDDVDVQSEESNIEPDTDALNNDAELTDIYRKVDWRIIPPMFFCYFLQFVDKVLINYANIMGLQQDLHMKGQDFSWMATAFFIGFAVAEFPQGWLLQKFPISKVLGLNVLCWGIVVCCSAAAQNFAAITALRTLLGCLEAIISPALIMTTSMWYTKRQSTSRYGIWYCGLGCGQIIGGLISFAAQHSPASSSLHSWRIMFLCVGAVNILAAIYVLTLFPDTVASATFLSPSQKATIHARLAFDQAGNGPRVFNPAALRETALDPAVWLLFLLTILIVIPSGVISTFSATLIRGFGYSPKQSALLNIPSGVVSILATLACTLFISSRRLARADAAELRNPPWYAQRCTAIALLLVPTIVGAGLMSFANHSQAAALAGIYLINTVVAPLALIYAFAGSNTQGCTKKVSVSALLAVAFGIANIIGPQTFQAKDAAGGYLPAKITVLAVNAASLVVVAALRVVYGMRNSRNARHRREGVQSEVETKALTDLTNPIFRYIY